MADRSPAIQGFRTRDKGRDAARQAVLTVIVLTFVVAPLIITQSIVYLDPVEALALLAVIGVFVVVLVPLHDRAVDMKPFFWGLIFYFALYVIWPRFLSIRISHLPLISPTRLTLFLLLATWGFMVATSSTVHDELWRRLKGVPVLSVSIVGLIVFMALAIPFALVPKWSAKMFFNDLIALYITFVAAVSLIRTRRNLETFIHGVVLLAMITSVLLIAERITHVNPFTTYLARFVNFQAAWLQGAVGVTMRGDIVRAKGPFLGPLDAAEYLVLALPFAFYWAQATRSRWWRWALIASVPLSLGGIWATDGRNSIVTSIMLMGLYGAVRGGRFLHAQRKSRLRPLIVLGLVGLAVAVVIAISVALVKLNWQTAFGASGSRTAQIELGIPKIAHRPVIGYGPGMQAITLGYSANGRNLTIDNYYLSVVLEAGIPGLLFFMTMLGATVVGSVRRMFSNPSERGLMLAFALIGIGFAFTRFTLSSSDNLCLFYIILGAYVAAMRVTSLDADAAAELEAETGKERRVHRRTIVGSARWRRQVRLR